MAKIMIGDDEPDIIFTTKRMLEREGYDVEVARSGKECLDRIKKEKPDIVLLDIMMSKIDGWEVCKKIKESKMGVPVSMLSVRRSDDSVKKSLEYAHADNHLTKPINIKEVIKTVKDLV
ncbi:MAG: response regulator transcription factor [Candidatus Hydrothermarchaeales archaeon]